MELISDNLVSTGISLSFIVLIGLIVIIWRGVTARRALRSFRAKGKSGKKNSISW